MSYAFKLFLSKITHTHILIRMLRAILNKFWWQHPTRHQRYGHLPPITKTIRVRRTRHAGHCWRSRDELISDVLLWTPTYGRAKAVRPARTYIQQDTGCSPEGQRRWKIGRSGESGSGISVLAARHDDDDIYTHAGCLESSSADQDTLMESDQMRFFFSTWSSLRFSHFFHQYGRAWIHLVKNSSTSDFWSWVHNFFKPKVHNSSAYHVLYVCVCVCNRE